MTLPKTALTRPLLMVVDDEPPVLKVIERLAGKAGFDVVTCGSGSEAMRALMRKPADLAMVDLRMPDVNGLDLLRQIRSVVPSCEVILMTAYAAVDSAVEAIKLGAREYLTKPFDFDRLREVLGDIRLELERRAQVVALEGQMARQLEFCGMLGRSPAMQEVFSLIQRLAPHAKVVLITGETGTGKELAARAFHQSGPRRGRPFVTINCSAVVDTLFESELFGHVRGAFTGAVDSKPGVFEAAQGGVLFLDEVGELPFAVQAKLLRAIEFGEVQRVGSLQAKRVDVSVIARACMLADGTLISERELAGAFPPDVVPGAAGAGRSRIVDSASTRGGDLPPRLQEIERDHIVDVLRRVNGNRMAAARLLGIS